MRLSKLAKYGLVDRIAQGRYRLTDDGRAFLNEELDASDSSRERSEVSRTDPREVFDWLRHGACHRASASRAAPGGFEG